MYVVATVALVLAMLSKPTAMVVPAQSRWSCTSGGWDGLLGRGAATAAPVVRAIDRMRRGREACSTGAWRAGDAAVGTAAACGRRAGVLPVEARLPRKARHRVRLAADRDRPRVVVLHGLDHSHRSALVAPAKPQAEVDPLGLRCSSSAYHPYSGSRRSCSSTSPPSRTTTSTSRCSARRSRWRHSSRGNHHA